MTKGFTLVELMVVVVIIAILFTLALPNSAKSWEARSSSVMRNEAFAIMGEGRTTAVETGKTVLVVAERTLLYVCLDENADFNCTADPGSVGTPDPSGDMVLAKLEVRTPAIVAPPRINPLFGFSRKGFLINSSGQPTTGQIVFCAADGFSDSCKIGAAEIKLDLTVLGLIKALEL